MADNQFAFPASLTETPELSTVTAYNVGAEAPLYTATSRHPNWTAIIFGLRAGDENVWSLFDVAGGVMQRLQQVSDRYSWDGSNVLFDGDVQEGPFAALLARAISEGNVANYTALAKFGEKVAQNPSDNSREQMFRFLANFEFQITPEGDVVAYKSVTDTGKRDEQGRVVYLSGFASQAPGVPSAFVNGKAVPPLSRVPQSVGDKVSMPRSEVVDDPNQSCARGLHVATVNYWNGGWNKDTLEVHVHPRAFVSVPNCEDAKARVHEYTVARVVTDVPVGGTVISDQTAPAWAGDVGYRV